MHLERPTSLALFKERSYYNENWHVILFLHI